MDAADIAESTRAQLEALTPRTPYVLPAGVPGECGCGNVSPRLIGGMCGKCRDEGRVK
jgi:hypothetical protein